jgi:hypothetical protein
LLPEINELNEPNELIKEKYNQLEVDVANRNKKLASLATKESNKLSTSHKPTDLDNFEKLKSHLTEKEPYHQTVSKKSANRILDLEKANQLYLKYFTTNGKMIANELDSLNNKKETVDKNNPIKKQIEIELSKRRAETKTQTPNNKSLLRPQSTKPSENEPLAKKEPNRPSTEEIEKTAFFSSPSSESEKSSSSKDTNDKKRMSEETAKKDSSPATSPSDSSSSASSSSAKTKPSTESSSSESASSNMKRKKTTDNEPNSVRGKLFAKKN